jgi:hypothetical protein
MTSTFEYSSGHWFAQLMIYYRKMIETNCSNTRIITFGHHKYSELLIYMTDCIVALKVTVSHCIQTIL